MTRPDIANAVRAVARQAHDPAERHWRAVRKIIAYLNKTKDLGLVFVKDGDRKLSVYVDADYANKDNDRRSVSGVAVMVGGTVVNASVNNCVERVGSRSRLVVQFYSDEL